MAKISDIDIPSTLWQEQGSAPSTPASTKWRLYFKAAGLFHKDDAGSEIGPLGVSGAVTFVGAKAYSDATQSISDITETAVTFNQEEYDTDGFHDNATNNTRFTVPSGKGGKYLLVGGITLVASASPVDGRVWWRLNGTTGIRSGVRFIPNASTETGAIVSTPVTLAVGDYVELMVFQDSSGSRNIGHASLQQIQSFGSVSLIGT